MVHQSGELENTLAGLLARRETRSQLRRLTTVAPSMVDFSSNSYLSLSSHPEIQRRYLSLLQSTLESSSLATCTSILGSGGSRLLDGNTTFAESLERDIASFHGAPSGLLFNSGFDANVGLFSCVPQPGDIIVYDELIHASVHDGMRLSRASQMIAFRHNTVAATNESDGLKGLDNVLCEIVASGEAGEAVLQGKRNVFVAIEGVYSMDGDVAPISDIVKCLQDRLPRGNGYLIVDEAHSTGVFGQDGRGLVSELGLEQQVFARVHTFGKAMGCSGAIILSSPTLRAYLINYARTLIYTTAMAMPSLASIKVTYDFLKCGEARPLMRNLRRLMEYTHSTLQSLCITYQPASELLCLDEEPPSSPIIPLFTSHPRSLAEHCQHSGFMVRPIVAPTVPLGSERVRICLHAGNSEAQIDGLSRAVEQWLQDRMRKEASDSDSESGGQQSAQDQEQTQVAKARL